MQPKDWYHLVLNLLLPGSFAFGRGHIRTGFLVMWGYLLGLALLFIGTAGMFEHVTHVFFYVGIILSVGCWAYAQLRFIKNFKLVDGNGLSAQERTQFKQALTHYLQGEYAQSRACLKQCDRVAPPSGLVLDGLISAKQDKRKAASARWLNAYERSESTPWRFFISTLKRRHDKPASGPRAQSAPATD